MKRSFLILIMALVAAMADSFGRVPGIPLSVIPRPERRRLLRGLRFARIPHTHKRRLSFRLASAWRSFRYRVRRDLIEAAAAGLAVYSWASRQPEFEGVRMSYWRWQAVIHLALNERHAKRLALRTGQYWVKTATGGHVYRNGGWQAVPAGGSKAHAGQVSPLYYKKVAGGLPVLMDMSVFPGNIFFVDAGDADGGDTAGKGTTPDIPFLTIDFAIGQCTASQGDVIFALPGHTETVSAAAGIDFDVAGLTVIGVGKGADRPAVTLDAVASTVHVDAASTHIENILFDIQHDSTIVIDVDKADCTVRNCEFRARTAATAREWVTGIDVNGGSANACDRTKIIGNVFRSPTAGADNAIGLDEVAANVEIVDNEIWGDWNDAGIHNPTGKVLTQLLIEQNNVENLQTGDHAIELVSACTGRAVNNRLYADTPGIVFDPGSLRCTSNFEAHKIDSPSVPSPAGLSGPDAWIHVAKTTATLPASTTQNLFTVAGGRVLVKLLLGEVTTVVQAQACNMKVTSVPTTGTAVDLASNLDINADEAGTLYLVEGDGTALVGANAGAALSGVGLPGFIVPVGTVRIETSATNTGATKWDAWYIPLDSGARVVSA